MCSNLPINKNLKVIISVLEDIKNQAKFCAEDSWKRLEIHPSTRCRELVRYGSYLAEFTQSDIVRISLDYYLFGSKEFHIKNSLEFVISLLNNPKRKNIYADGRPQRLVTLVTPRCYGVFFLTSQETVFRIPDIAGMALDDFFFGHGIKGHEFPGKLRRYTP